MAESIINFIIYTLGIMFLVAFGVISAIILWKMIKKELKQD
jgi:predicted outer membrane lipoprotein